MPHTSRRRSSRGDSRGAKFKRSSLGKAETTRNRAEYIVTFVWGAQDMTQRNAVMFGRREAFRYAKIRAAQGARIVVLKKGSFATGQKVIADFSTVGGAR